MRTQLLTGTTTDVFFIGKFSKAGKSVRDDVLLSDPFLGIVLVSPPDFRSSLPLVSSVPGFGFWVSRNAGCPRLFLPGAKPVRHHASTLSNQQLHRRGAPR